MIKKTIITLIAVIILIAVPVSMNAETSRIVDNAGLLTRSEISSLEETLDEISERLSLDVAVLTQNGTHGGMSTSEYAESFFEDNYGYGDESDGVILFVNMSDREWHIATSGYAITAITDYGLERIEDEVVKYLSDGKFYRAFSKYADICDELVTEAKSGNIYDIYDDGDNMHYGYGYDSSYRKASVFSFSNLVISLIFGCIVSLITVSSMKSQLKPVRMQNNASSYVKKNSFNVTDARDVYLYRRVRKTPRPKDPPQPRSSFGGSGRGSTIHTSSSGRSFGGRGGKF